MSFHAVNVCTLAKVKVVAVMFAVKKDFLHILSGRQGVVKVEFNGKTFAAFLLAFHVLILSLLVIAVVVEEFSLKNVHCHENLSPNGNIHH